MATRLCVKSCVILIHSPDFFLFEMSRGESCELNPTVLSELFVPKQCIISCNNILLLFDLCVFDSLLWKQLFGVKVILISHVYWGI